MTRHLALRAHLATSAKHLHRLIDDIHDILAANMKVYVAVLALALDAKLARAILHQLMLVTDCVFDLPLARSALDVLRDRQAVSYGWGRVARLVDER